MGNGMQQWDTTWYNNHTGVFSVITIMGSYQILTEHAGSWNEDAHTHTHLLRNILSNYWCGMHRTCTNTSFKPDRRKWMTRREKQWRRILSTSLLDATVPSDEVSSKSDCENRTGKNQIWFESRFEIRLAGSRLGRLPWTKMKKIEQVRGLSVPNPYHCATDASSLDGDIWSTLHPPAK